MAGSDQCLVSHLCSVLSVQNMYSSIVGVDDGEGPPVPIPNTEVKLTDGDNTCLATDREDSKMPTQTPEAKASGVFLPRSFCDTYCYADYRLS